MHCAENDAVTTHYILDEAVQIFRRNGTKNWQMRFSVEGQGQIKKSLKTSDLDEAKKLARKEYLKAVSRDERGLQANARSFKNLTSQFLDHYYRRVTRGEKSEDEFRGNVKGVVERYFDNYFNDQAIDTISSRDINKYQDWRRDYWLTGPGSSIDVIQYQRSGKTVERPAIKQVPSISRQNRELVLLKQIFKFASQEGYLEKSRIPEFVKPKGEYKQAPGLTEDELEHLLDVAQERIDETKDEKLRRARSALRAFVAVASATGMRPTELYNMRWGDVEYFDGEQDAFAPMENEVQILARGKGKHRRLVPLDRAVIWIDLQYQKWKATFEDAPSKEDPVFFDNKGKPIKSFKNGLNHLFEAAGLLHDQHGRKRTAYAFRHHYITQRILSGTDLHILALNTGTSVRMIEKHYSHAKVEQFDSQLRERHQT